MEKIFSFAWKGKRGMTEDSDDKARPHENYVNDEQGLQRRHNVDTLLQVITLLASYRRLSIYLRRFLIIKSCVHLLASLPRMYAFSKFFYVITGIPSHIDNPTKSHTASEANIV